MSFSLTFCLVSVYEIRKSVRMYKMGNVMRKQTGGFFSFFGFFVEVCLLSS